MKKLFFLAFWLLAANAYGQTGLLFRTNCSAITTPVANQTACIQTTTAGGRVAGGLYVWGGSTWAAPPNVSALNEAAGTLAGRGAASGSGLPQQITLGTSLSMSGTTLNASLPPGAGCITSGASMLKGDGSGGCSNATPGTDFVAPGSATTSGLTQNTAKLLGRGTAGAGAIEEIALGTNLSLSGTTLNATGGGGGVATGAGTYASLPAAGNSGNLFFTTDSVYTLRDNGSTWDSWAYSRWAPVPPASGWTWINQSTATFDQSQGYLFLSVPAGNNDGMHLRNRALATPPYTLDVMVMGSPLDGGTYAAFNYQLFTIGWRDSATGKLVLYWVDRTSGPNTAVSWSKWDNATTFNANYFADFSVVSNATLQSRPFWMRLTDNGTNFNVAFSYDGLNWITPHAAVSRTDFLANPDEFVAGVFCGGCGETVNAYAISWYVH